MAVSSRVQITSCIWLSSGHALLCNSSGQERSILVFQFRAFVQELHVKGLRNEIHWSNWCAVVVGLAEEDFSQDSSSDIEINLTDGSFLGITLHRRFELQTALFLKQSCQMVRAAHTGIATARKALHRAWRSRGCLDYVLSRGKLPRSYSLQRCYCSFQWLFDFFRATRRRKGRAWGLGEKWWMVLVERRAGSYCGWWSLGGWFMCLPASNGSTWC